MRPPVTTARQLQQEAIVEQQALSSDVESFNTSDILKVKGGLEALVEEALPSIQSDRASHSDKENVQPTPSSPTARMLRIAHEAIAQGYEEPIRQSSKVTDRMLRCVDEDERGHNSHASGNEGPRRNRPHLRDLDVNGFAYRPMHNHATMRGEGPRQQVQHDAENVSAVGFYPEDDEMLDGHATFEPIFADYVDATADRVPEFTYGPPGAESDMHSPPFRYDRRSTRRHAFSWSRGDMSATHRETPSFVATAEQGLLHEGDHIGVRDFENGLEGFWRPNRLY